jgi:microcystin-dependent protein
MASILTNTGVKFPDNTEQNTALPINAIAFWTGSIASIPTGWQLCDGTNGTPDLRDKFIVCAGSSYSISSTGGSNTVSLSSPQLPPHTHDVASSSISPAGTHSHPSPAVTSQGNHTHTMAGINNAGAAIHGPGPGAYQGTPVSGPGGGHSHPTGVGTNPDHAHTVTIASGDVGSGGAHENRPPFYALAFIMEVA